MEFSLWYLLPAVLALAYGSAAAAERVIEYEYEKLRDELEFPDCLWTPARRKKYLIAIFLIAYGIAVATVPSISALIFYLMYAAILGTVCITDAEQQIIPDLFPAVLLFLGIAATPFLPVPFMDRFAAGIGVFILFFLFAVLTHGGIGGGDIKLIGVIGFWLGPEGVLHAVLFGICSAGVVSLFLVLTGRKGRKDMIAYGPYLAGGGLLAAWIGYL